MADVLLLDKNNKKTTFLEKAVRKLDLIERHSSSLVYVDPENFKRKTITAFADRRYAKNSAGLYVECSDEVRQGDELRVASSALNFQAIPDLGQFHHYDDGFNKIRAVEEVYVEIKGKNGKWKKLDLKMRPGELESKEGKKDTWNGYRFVFNGDDGRLVVLLSRDEVGGKGDYKFTSKNSENAEYRLKIQLTPTKGWKTFHKTEAVTHTPTEIKKLGTRTATWEYGPNDGLSFDWLDMITNEDIDFSESLIAESGVTLCSKSFLLKPGESFQVDPVITPGGASSGGGGQSDSAWSIDGTGGNSFLAGTYAPSSVVARGYVRFTYASFTGTINDSDLTFYVTGHLGNFNYDSLLIGDYNDTGQGNPATDAYSTAYSRADVQADFFVNDTSSRTTGSKTVDLGTTADSHIASSSVNGEYTVCFNDDNANPGVTTGPWIAAHNNTTTGNRPVLTIDYTETGGGAVKSYLIQTTINNRRRRV